jgi:opacity protein-like surface antigen
VRRPAALALLLAALAVSDAAAQTSLYGVLGVGYPGRPSGVRSRTMGSGIDGVDPGSAMNPAAISEIDRLTAAVSSITSFRSFEIEAGGGAQDVRDTRFPYASIAGVISGTPVTFAASYGIYAERTFDLVTGDTIELRGDSITILDRTRSDGAIVDLRGAVAWDISYAVAVGAAVHVITGSTRETLTRLYGDSAYLPLDHNSQVKYSGLGFSGGIMFYPIRSLRVGATFRTDNRISLTRDGVAGPQVELPITVSGGLEYRPAPSLRLGVTAAWRSWGDADQDLADLGGVNAFDTWEVGAGLELGTRFPIRLGFRYAQLPFSPLEDQPREIDLVAGAGLLLGGGRAAFDLGLERVMRDGGGASERAWQWSLGVAIRP